MPHVITELLSASLQSPPTDNLRENLKVLGCIEYCVKWASEIGRPDIMADFLSALEKYRALVAGKDEPTTADIKPEDKKAIYIPEDDSEELLKAITKKPPKGRAPKKDPTYYDLLRQTKSDHIDVCEYAGITTPISSRWLTISGALSFVKGQVFNPERKKVNVKLKKLFCIVL